jgi:hypothetical protein
MTKLKAAGEEDPLIVNVLVVDAAPLVIFPPPAPDVKEPIV